MIDQNTQNQSNNCKEWMSQLDTLKTKHAEFLDAHKLACEQKNESNMDTAFNRCKKKKDEIKLTLQQLDDELPSEKRLMRRIHKLSLDKEQKEKLLLLIMEQGYSEAATTAKELDPDVQVPSHDQVLKSMLNLGREKLKKMAIIMTKPGLIIVPGKSMIEIKEAMDSHRHLKGQDMGEISPDYNWSESTGQTSVSIVDITPNPEYIPGQNISENNIREQYIVCEKYYEDNGMRLITDRQYAVALQRSLRLYKLARKRGEFNARRYVLDRIGKMTMLRSSSNPTLMYVAWGRITAMQNVQFAYAMSRNVTQAYYGRGAITLIE